MPCCARCDRLSRHASRLPPPRRSHAIAQNRCSPFIPASKRLLDACSGPNDCPPVRSQSITRLAAPITAHPARICSAASPASGDRLKHNCTASFATSPRAPLETPSKSPAIGFAHRAAMDLLRRSQPRRLRLRASATDLVPPRSEQLVPPADSRWFAAHDWIRAMWLRAVVSSTSSVRPVCQTPCPASLVSDATCWRRVPTQADESSQTTHPCSVSAHPGQSRDGGWSV